MLYSGLLEQCPKCNALLAEHEEPPAQEAPKNVRVRQWIGLCIGVPALIAVLYYTIRLLVSLS